MRKLVVVENLSLDGVMQAPGRADEDSAGGFAHGGWAMAYNDSVKGQAMAEGMRDAGPLLFGRRTYEDFFRFWPKQRDNPFTDVLNQTRKYVVSGTLTEPLPWANSTLVSGDMPAAVAQLKARGNKDLVVLGSGILVQSLMRHNLVDEFVLMIHPLVLRAGRRLFDAEAPRAALQLLQARPTTTGVIIATYRPAPAPDSVETR